MLRTIQTLLLWLLLAAIPVQGIAAAAMMSCRSLEHAATHVAAGATGLHGTVAIHNHHHHAAHASAKMHDADAPLNGAAHSHDKHDASSSCSACAACCIGAAPLPSGLDWTVARNRSEPVDMSPSPFMSGFIPPAIERPPRSLSA